MTAYQPDLNRSGQKLVLIVDDVEDNRILLDRGLKSCAMRPKSAKAGARRFRSYRKMCLTSSCSIG